jgi:hypothetical protein
LVAIIRVDGVDHVGVVEQLANCPSRMLRFPGEYERYQAARSSGASK